ncbi:MAG: hypothetical protein IJT40_04145 [Firmicutes bacterium]|nr:hypothetical protein [Bacillota bacterium]
MSKPLTYTYKGTKGHIAAVASSLPSDPSSLLGNGWKDISDSNAASAGHMKIRERSTGLILGFDRATPGAPGFRGENHYHIFNPNATGNGDLYLDKFGNPVKKNSKASHILPSGR